MNSPSNKTDYWLQRAPWLLGGAALVFFILTHSTSIAPGLPVQIANTVRGAYYLPITQHFLYQQVAQWFLLIVPGSDWFALSLFSALCGAGALVLFHRLMFLAPRYDRLGEIPDNIQQRALSISALGAVFFLMVAVPFWSASTQPQYLTFDLLLVLISLTLTLRPPQQPSLKCLAAATWVYGLGITEYAIMAVGSPFFILLILYTLWRRGLWSWPALRRIALYGGLGLCAYGLPVLAMCLTPDCGYGEFNNGWMVLLDLWKKQWREAKDCLPSVGGLLIILSTFVPWGYVLFFQKPKPLIAGYLDELKTTALLAITGLGVLLLLERGFSPYQLAGSYSNNIIPYLLIASWMGYLTGYWWLRATAPRVYYIPLFIQRLWTLPALLIALLLPTLFIFNYRTVHPPEAVLLTNLARDIQASCSNRRLLFSSGTPFDDTVRWLGQEQSAPFHLIATPQLTHASFRTYLETTVSPIVPVATPQASGDEFIRRFVADNEGACAFVTPDLALKSGFLPVPYGLIFTPGKSLRSLDAEQLFSTNQSLHALFADHIGTLQHGPRTPLSIALLRHYSRSVNNLGVILRQLSRNDLAERAFKTALDILPQNINALMNLRDLYVSSADRSSNPEIRRKAQDLLDRAVAVSHDLGANAGNIPWLAAEYGVLYSGHEAQRSVQRLRRNNVDQTPSYQNLIRIAQAQGNAAQALAVLREANKDQPNQPVILEALLEAYSRTKNLSETRRTALALVAVDPQNTLANLTLASYYDHPEKQESFLRQAVLDTDHALHGYALNNLAYSLIQQGKCEEAATVAEEAVRWDPANDKFQHTLATAYLRLGQYDAAREHLQLALLRAPRNPNHLVLQAELALAENKLIEAQKLAQEALPQLRDEWRERALSILGKGR